MPYVARNEAGEVVGKFANPQDGIETVWMEDDHPDLMPKLNARLVSEALDCLSKSDITLGRCLENQVEFPKEWKQYRQSLRDAVSGKLSDLPEQPDYPKGS